MASTSPDAADGTGTFVGDTIQTHRITSEIPTNDHDRIRNGDVCTVAGAVADGCLEVRHATRPASATLPAD